MVFGGVLNILELFYRAYDRAAMKCNGKEAVTNFDPSIYENELGKQFNSEDIQGLFNHYSIDSYLFN